MQGLEADTIEEDTVSISILNSCYAKGFLGPATSASCGCFLETQTLSPHPRPAEPDLAF